MLKDDLLKYFLAAHIVKQGEDLLYDGDISRLSDTVDSGTANNRYDKLDDNIEFNQYKLALYGDNHSIIVPVFSDNVIESEITNATNEYRILVSDYLKDGLFSDKRGAIIFKILDTFNVGIYEGMVAFQPQGDVGANLIKTALTTSIISVGTFSTDIDVNCLNDIQKYESLMLLFKEVSDGYYDVRKHSIVDKRGLKLVQQEYLLGRDIYCKINTETKEVIELSQTETKYNLRKDKDGYYVIRPDGSEINSRDFLAYETETDGDITIIKMFGAYTHVLRELLDFKPLTWQFKFLLNQKRLSFVAGCRRAGKTRLMAYLILRSLRRCPNSIKHIQRQVKSLYLAPSNDKQKDVVDYIKATSDRIRILKVLDFNKKENRLYLYDEVVGRNQKTQNVVSSCDFVSAKGFEPGRGKASDEIFIDEGSITPEDAFSNLLPIIGNERAKLFTVGTIDWKTRKQWFYQWLVESEKGIEVDQYGLRVTIDDLDDEHVPEEDKNRMKRMLISNKDRYYAELYASFPDNNGVFNNEGFFSITKERQPFDKVGGYIIGYDPAKRTDIGAIEIGEYRMNAAGGAYIQLIEEYSLQGEYTQQKEVLKSLKDRYKNNGLGAPVFVVIDATQVGDVVSEMFGDIIDYKVWYTAKGTRPVIDAYGAWKVPKNHLVHLSQILIEKGLIKGWVGLKDLVSQLKNFKAIDTPSGNVKYEAEVGHDDHVNAMMLIGFYVGYIEGRVYEFAMEGQVIRQEGITDEGLYEEMNQRSVTQLEELIGKGYNFGV